MGTPRKSVDGETKGGNTPPDTTCKRSRRPDNQQVECGIIDRRKEHTCRSGEREKHEPES
jgi:hypothetical protein